jgi:hypothetical protein
MATKRKNQHSSQLYADPQSLERLFEKLLLKDSFPPPKTFCNGRSIEEHLGNVRRYIHATNITNVEAQIAVLVNSLEEDVQVILFSQPQYEQNSDNYEWLSEKLVTLFRQKPSAVSPLANLLQMKQTNEQSLRKYASDLRHKTHSTQNTDPDITMIIKIMKSGKLLDKNPDELHCASREAKLLWKKRERLRIRGDELYFLTPDDKYKWVVPANERKRLVFSTHKGCGHIGITKTTTLVKEKYFWPEMEYDIRILINTCKPCRERKSAGVRQLPEPQMTFTSFPFEKIALDITGPLRPCKSGERFILGIVDYFTKFPQLIPLHNTDSKTVAKALFQHWICIFGAPLVIHTDRGTDFESNLFHELCAINGISKTKTAPFYPKSDGLIERLFSTVKDMIFATTQDTSMDWKESLPIICMGLRSSIQRTTKVAPYEVLFGQRMRTPLCWQYPIPDEHIQKSSRSSKIAERQMVSEYILDLQYRLKQLHMSIRKTINNKRSIETTGNKISRPLPIGTVVMARILPITKGIDKPRFDGPYTIIHHLGKWTYRLKHTTSGKIIERNIHHVKTVNFAESMKIIRPQHSSGTSVLVPTIERPSRARVPPSRYGFSGI